MEPAYLKRALTNLLINSVQAMPNGGKLTIEVKQSDNKATITVIDTGGGIPENVRANLFTPLFTTKSKGQGLGLAVEGLNGKVSFRSEEGTGTEFIIELPTL